MVSAAKARAARAVEARRHDHGLMPTHHVLEAAKPPSGWIVLKKSVRGVVTAFVASAKPLGLAGVVVGLVWLALKIVDRFQLWMTAAGVLMVVMSVASAFQEVGKQSTATVEFLDEDVEGCTKMITIPSTVTAQQQAIALTMTSAAAVATASSLNAASPALVAMPSPPPRVATDHKKKTKATLPSTEEAMVKPVRRNSSTIELGDNKLTVVHCGTVIDVQGSRGFIIPHSSGLSKPSSRAAAGSFRRASTKPSIATALPEMKLPFVIAFELTAVLAVLRHQIMVGQTVEFSFPGDENSLLESVLAVNVKPVAPELEIAKSRTALQTCKLAREESFAKAMGQLTMLSPRNEPIKHHVDLIKYAEHLDDELDSPLDQFI